MYERMCVYASVRMYIFNLNDTQRSKEVVNIYKRKREKELQEIVEFSS